MKHGFLKVAAARVRISVADCESNVREMKRAFSDAQKAGVKLLVYPELCVSAGTCGDIFLSDALLDSAKKYCLDFVASTQNTDTISIIGLPLIVNDKIYNSCVVCQNGRVLGVVPKSNISADEARYFAEPELDTEYIKFGSDIVPFGVEQIFFCSNLPEFRFGVEIGDAPFASVSPSQKLCAEGALIIANPACLAESIGKSELCSTVVRAHSSKNVCAYIRADAGEGESTTDRVFGGELLICERGEIIAKEEAFGKCDIIVTEVDLKTLLAERRRTGSHKNTSSDAITVDFPIKLAETKLTRHIPQNPFLPDGEKERSEVCKRALDIAAHALAQRIERAYAKKCVIGISGGLDSCLAQIVCAEALSLIGRSCGDLLAVTMPGFATTTRTKTNAELLCEEMGAELRTVDITRAVRGHFEDIGHDEKAHDVVYENSQARERTQILMDIANEVGGIVIGTGDLSELALGWATYNGDHMSMYAVNAGIPKTAVREIVRYYAERVKKEGKEKLSEVLFDILATPISPELLPPDENGRITQKTEDLVGPYEIHDFYIYYTLRYGMSPDKLFRIAKYALGDKYSDAELLRWLESFARRFFSQQFKRSCMPDGPQIFDVSLSPRAAWKMPSDACGRAWLDIIKELK